MVVRLFLCAIAAACVSPFAAEVCADPIKISEEHPELLLRHIPSPTVLGFDECQIDRICGGSMPHGRGCDTDIGEHAHCQPEADHSTTHPADPDPATTFSDAGLAGPTGPVVGAEFAPDLHHIASSHPPTPIPEPGTLTLLGFLFCFICFVRIRRPAQRRPAQSGYQAAFMKALVFQPSAARQ